MKLSNLTGVIAYSGGQLTLREGQTVDDNHPIVAERPELFRDIEDGVGQTAQTPNPRVVESTMQTGPGGGRVRRVSGQ
jgi:hypothetical protein